MQKWHWVESVVVDDVDVTDAVICMWICSFYSLLNPHLSPRRPKTLNCSERGWRHFGHRNVASGRKVGGKKGFRSSINNLGEAWLYFTLEDIGLTHIGWLAT